MTTSLCVSQSKKISVIPFHKLLVPPTIYWFLSQSIDPSHNLLIPPHNLLIPFYNQFLSISFSTPNIQRAPIPSTISEACPSKLLLPVFLSAPPYLSSISHRSSTLLSQNARNLQSHPSLCYFYLCFSYGWHLLPVRGPHQTDPFIISNDKESPLCWELDFWVSRADTGPS